MQVTSAPLTSTTRRLSVELSADDLRRYIEKTERAISRQVTVDGFRPGTAPADALRARVGKDAILQQALENALQGSLADALTQEHLDVLRVSDLRIEENSATRLAYEITATLYPEVTLPDLQEIKVSRRAVEVTDEEITQTLETVRRYRANLSMKEGPAAEQDRVEVSFTIRKDGEVVTGGESKNHPLIIGGKSFLPGFEEQLVGMKVGEEKDFSLTIPAEYPRKDVAGKALDVHVVVNVVQTVQLPELDDEFARKAGKFENLAQLRTNVIDGIRQEKEEKERERVRLAVLDAIIGRAQVEVPAAMAEEQLDEMVAGFDRQLHEREMEIGMYLAHAGKTQDDLRKDWRKDAERQVKIRLALHAIGMREGITVTNEEVEEALNTVVQSLVVRQNIPVERIDIQHIRQQVSQQAVNEKVLDFIEARCVVE